MGKLRTRTYASLLAYREGERLTQTEAAAKFGLTQSMWSLYESGTYYPSRLLAKQIADETGVPLEIVLGLQQAG